ncbi:MAG: cobalamin biosynthesis protein CobQ [Oscillospiraceae bacterium]|jgi:hypothetical protein|nr:cobalamin biosynthesis protein CobQ [Oscillospiraceae bacterium]
MSKVTIVTGHYGSGKTNLAVNLALWQSPCRIADLDIVNPFFRTADFAELFLRNNIQLNVSSYANTNLDIPALNFGLSAEPTDKLPLIIDVGGDDEGAKALGRYKNVLNNREVEFIYVVNFRRFLTQTPSEAERLMREIEAASGTSATAIVNNTNLGEQTTADIIESSVVQAKELSRITNLPLLFTTAKAGLFPSDRHGIKPIDVFVKTFI